jgi:FkbM family methyltransferase
VPSAHVVCIEPIPEQAELLRRRFERCNVTVICAAAGDRDGQTQFHQVSGSYSSSVLPMSRHKTEFPSVSIEVATYPVQLGRLDTILGDLWVEQSLIDLLKIDVQGYELPVLEGAQKVLSRCRHVLIEMSLRPLYEGQSPFEEVVCWLYKHGFRMIDYVEGTRSHVTGELLQMDFLYMACNLGEFAEGR